MYAESSLTYREPETAKPGSSCMVNGIKDAKPNVIVCEFRDAWNLRDFKIIPGMRTNLSQVPSCATLMEESAVKSKELSSRS